MAIRDWFRINWRSWRFWIGVVIVDIIASFIFDGKSITGFIFGIIFGLIFKGLGYGAGFIPGFVWWILGIFLLFRFRRFFGKIAGGTGSFLRRSWLTWPVGAPLWLIGKILGYGKSAKWQGLRGKYKGIRGAYLGNILRQITKDALIRTELVTKRFPRLKNIAGREPEIVYRNRILFMRLLDQELRYDIWYTKYLVIQQNAKVLEESTTELGDYKYMDELKKLLILLRSNRGKLRVLVRGNEEMIGEDPNLRTIHAKFNDYVGWGYVNKLVVGYMRHLHDFFEQQYRAIEAVPRAERGTLYSEFGQECNRKRGSEVGKIETSGVNSMNEYMGTQKIKGKLGIFKEHHTIRLYALHIWDMYNNWGSAIHPYRFAKRGAEYLDEDGTTLQTITNDTTEVDVFGRFAEDLRRLNENPAYKQEVVNGTRMIRRLINPRRDSVPFPPNESMGEIGQDYVKDWQGFIFDWRDGRFHKKSRTVKEYEDAWSKGIWKDDEMGVPTGASETEPAFDLRALVNWDYNWQGRHTYDGSLTDIYGESTEPHISQIGIIEFIKRLNNRTIKQTQETERFLAEKYPSDTRQMPGTLEEQKTKPVVGPFGIKRT